MATKKTTLDAAPDWTGDDDGDEVPASTPTPAPAAPTPALPTKPDVLAHKSRPNLALPNPDLAGKPAETKSVGGVAAMIDDQPDAAPLPSNYMQCIPILERLRQIAAQVMTRSERDGVRVRIQKLKQHIFALQQGLPTVHIDHNQMQVQRAAHIVNAESKRNERMAELKSAIGADRWLSIVPEKQLAEPLVDFLATPEAVEIITALRPALAAYELATLQNFLWLNPTMRKAEHKLALASRPSEEVTERIINEVQLMASEHFRILTSNKRGALHELYEASVKPRVELLLNSAMLFVTEAKLAAIVSEGEFFEANGNAPWHETGVSKRFDPVLVELRHRMDTLKNPRPIPYPSIGHAVPSAETILETIFGLPVLPQTVE